MPAIMLIFIWGKIILKYVVEYLLPINLEASSIDFEIFSNPESILLFDNEISLILKASTNPIIVELNTILSNESNINIFSMLIIKYITPKATTTPGTA